MATKSNANDLTVFLRKRNVGENVIQRFVDNKMDCESAAIASVEDLEELGLTAKGDILALQAFFKSRKSMDNREEKKKKLIDLIKGKKSSSKSKPSESSTATAKTKEKDRQISIGWLHFDTTSSRYIAVRAAKGGGTRYMTPPVTSSKDDILSACEDLFFPKGHSIHGDISSMTVNLGNFKCIVIDSLTLPNGTACDFTLQSYLDVHKLQRPRLYLMTKLKNICDQDMEVTEVSDGSTDDEVFPPAFSATNEKSNTGTSSHMVIPVEKHDESLEKDNQLKILQQDRLSRVPTEPDILEEHVLISVRHVQLGVYTRAFRPDDTMLAVYDWIGSLSAVPEYFHLYLQLPCRLLYPSEDVSVAQMQLLNMTVTEEPLPLDNKDGEISLRGFGPNLEVPKRSETSTNNEVPNSKPPRQLLVDDPDGNDEQGEDNEKTETINNQVYVSGGTMSTQTCMGHVCSTIYIRRTTIMEDMMKAFECSNILNANVSFVMIDSRGQEEMGEDSGGISRDAYSGFWQTFYDRCTLGEDQRVPALRHDFQVVQWQSIARILVKGYLQINYFPFLISKCFFTSMLLGETSVLEESLLDSFKEYVAKDEAQIVKDVLLGSSNPDDREVLEMVDRFGCRKLPNSENIRSIFLEISHKELIQKPQYVADCWAPICRQRLPFTELIDIDRVYEKSYPTNKKVLNLLGSSPVTNDGEKDALDYLKRLVRGLNQQDLSSFLKFVTGSDMICVDKITVVFTPLDGFQRRPIAHTCGAVLELPRTYQSFPELREEFSNILHQREWINDII